MKRPPVGFLVGAGCPASILQDDGKPLIPTIGQLTKEIVATLSAKDAALAATLIDRTRASSGVEPNVESLLSYVRALSVVLQAGDSQPMSKEQATDIDALICGSIVTVVDKRLPIYESSYRRLAAWALAASDQLQLEFFTTNYDLLLEEAFELLLVPYFDGFVGSNRPFFDLSAIENDVLPQRWTRLWKLHGSINWKVKDRQVFRTSEPSKDASLLIYPSHQKYDQSRRLPFVAMADRMLAFLRKDKATLT